MSSAAAVARLSLSKETLESGTEMAPCTACRNAKVKKDEPRPKCIAGLKSGRCSECVRKGYSGCDVTLSAPEWMKFRDMREKFRKELDEAEEEEIRLLHQQQDILARLTRHKAKKVRLRKQMRLAGERTDSAVARELDDLESADAVEARYLPVVEPDGVEAVEGASSSAVWEMPPSDWAGLCDVDFPLEGLDTIGIPVSSGGPS